MKRNILLSVLLLLSIAASAQLRVSSGGNVGIKATANSNSLLTVGSYNAGNASVGLTSSPDVMNKNNIGVEGVVSANSSYTNDTNYGVLGIVSPINYAHGRNFGVSGMIGYPLTGSPYNGAGVYGAHSTYFYSYPTNIQGAYAGYFTGSVYVSSNLTAPNLFTTSDSRLSDNIVSLGERDNSGNETLENVLNMNVVEYNLRSRLGEMPTARSRGQVLDSGQSPDQGPVPMIALKVIAEGDYLKISFENQQKSEATMTAPKAWSLSIINMQNGQIVYDGSINNGCEAYISMAGWKSGVYAIRGKIGEEEATKKIVVK